MDKTFETYIANFEKVEHKSFTGRLELEEFLNLLEIKCDCELAYARILQRIANYPFSALSNSPFEKAVDHIRTKASNKSTQLLELVENVKKDVHEPLKVALDEQTRRAHFVSSGGRNCIQQIQDAEETVTRMRDLYLKSIREAETAISNYEDKKRAGESARGGYRERLFHNLNAKITETEDRALHCE